MRIYVRTDLGRGIKIEEIEPSDSILNLKAKIQDKECIPPDQYTLEYRNRRLEDERNLEDYNILK